MRIGALKSPREASVKVSIKHAQRGGGLLDKSRLLHGTHSATRGASTRELSKAATAQQQRATLVRARLSVSTRRPAAYRSRSAPIGRAQHRVQKHRSRQLEFVPSNKTTQPDRHRAAARDAQQSWSRPRSALTLAQKRGQATGLLFSAAQRSRAARARAVANKEPAGACNIPACAVSTEQSSLRALKFSSRQPRGASVRRSTQPERLRAAARKAHLMHSRAQRANALSLKRCQITESNPSAAEARAAPGTHSSASQGAQQQAPMQADARSAPADMPQPPCPSIATVQQHTTAPQKHMDPAQMQHQHQHQPSRVPEQPEDWVKHSLGSPGLPERARDEGTPPYVDHPVTWQTHFSVVAQLAHEALQSSSAGEGHTQQQEGANAQEPCSTGMSPVTPALHDRNSGRHSMHSALSSGEFPDMSVAVSTPAAAEYSPLSHWTPVDYAMALLLASMENLPHEAPQAGSSQCTGAGLLQCLSDELIERASAIAPDASGQLGSPAGMPGMFGQWGSSGAAFPGTPPQIWEPPPASWNTSPQTPSQAAALQPMSCFWAASSPPPLPPPHASWLCTGEIVHGDEQPAWNEHSSSRGRAKPAQAVASSLCSKGVPHPKPQKGKLMRKPDWRTGSPDAAQSWLMYKKVLHRGKGLGGAAYQTMSAELPQERIKKRRPRFGDKSMLLVEERPEDDPDIPFRARLGKTQRDRVIKDCGGVVPQPGHKLHRVYQIFCKACRDYFPSPPSECGLIV